MNILILISTIFSSIIYSNEYIWPNDYEGEITTTFCEPRSRRFHAGIDIRTKGEIGSNIYAIDSGYIYRIKIEPYNYGKAIYLKLNDGNIVLYSHLINFNNDIEKLIKNLHLKYNSSFFDHILNENELIKLNKGDIIGYAGDTGSLGGPHIHFEIRSKDNEPINPLIDYYDIYDTISPVATSITFIPIDKNSWINNIQDYQTFNLLKENSNLYGLKDTVNIKGKFGIAIETHDEINDLLIFDFGVYNIDLIIDDELIYSITFDKYNFIENPLIYTEIDYSLLQKNIIAHRLFNKKNTLSFIKENNSMNLNLNKNYHDFLINISDVQGNITQLKGVISTDSLKNKTADFGQAKSNNINGDINIKYIDTGLILEFIENTYTGLIPELKISFEGNEEYYKVYRKDEKIVSSNIINPDGIDNISIIYNTDPKITFEKKIITINPKKEKEFILPNGITLKNINTESFYNDMILSINEDKNLPINEKFQIITKPLTINPTNIPFKKKLKLEYKSDINNHYAFYKYNEEKKLWKYIETTNENNKISTRISSGGTFCILSEKEQPIIYDIYPALDKTYKKDIVKSISFHIDDQISGINPYKIEIIFNDKKIFYDYIKYRKLVTANIENLTLGKNKIDIFIYDNLDNVKNISGSFLISE